MKKVSKVIIILLLIIITLSTIFFLNRKEVIYKEEKQKENNLISFMIENEEGKYVKAEENTWPDSEYFVLNQKLSGCENGGTLAWNTEKEKMEVSLSTSDKCYAYFTFNKEKYVRDLSGNNNHGKLNNIVSWNEEGLTTSDDTKVGYVDCGLAGYDFKNSISLVARIRVNKFTTSVHQRFFNNYSGFAGSGLAYNNSKTHYLSIIMDNVTYPENGTKGYKHLPSSKLLEENIWYTIIGTYDGITEKTYVDGVLTSSGKVTAQIPISNVSFWIGDSTLGDNGVAVEGPDYAMITITDALIFNRALTDSEIAQDFANKINPTNKQGLLLYYKFA